jgi:hypothetical protein
MAKAMVEVERVFAGSPPNYWVFLARVVWEFIAMRINTMINEVLLEIAIIWSTAFSSRRFRWLGTP